MPSRGMVQDLRIDENLICSVGLKAPDVNRVASIMFIN